MRKLYNEFFYIPKHGKVREKVMLTRIAMTVTIVIMCLAAMSITAYAYFSHNVTSASNTIQAANFEANVSIVITDSNSDPVTVTKDGKVQTATLDAGEYTVSLSKGASTANTGFCIITINDTDYFTQQIGNDVDRGLTDGSASVEFTLKVSSATKIEILSHWGTSKYYGYNKDEGKPETFIDSTGFLLDLTNDDGDKSEGNTEQSEDTTTTPSTDTTTPTTGTESSTPTTETTTPAETTTPETTGTTEPTTTTEPSSTESSEPTSTTEPAATESTDTTESTETQPTEETTGAPTTEASE